MLDRIFKKAWVLSLVLIAASPVWAQRGQGRRAMNGPGNGGTYCLALNNSIPKQSLDSTEAAGLAYMREEEKLAHDVYAALHSKWGLRVFGNISQSEDRHFSAIKLLLDRYELPDPAANNRVGVFQNEGLQGKRVLKSHFQRQDSALRYRCNQIEGIQVDILLISSRVRICREAHPRSNEGT